MRKTIAYSLDSLVTKNLVYGNDSLDGELPEGSIASTFTETSCWLNGSNPVNSVWSSSWSVFPTKYEHEIVENVPVWHEYYSFLLFSPITYLNVNIPPEYQHSFTFSEKIKHIKINLWKMSFISVSTFSKRKEVVVYRWVLVKY